MRVAIPHDLDRATVRERLRNRGHRIADHIPGGMAQVSTSWASEDRMDLSIGAMGQQLAGRILVEDRQVVVEMTLPAALGFLQPVIEGAIRQQGHRLIAPPDAS